MFKIDYPKEATDKAKVDSTEYDGKLLGENDLGTAHIHGLYGNKDSSIKIAYLIGMHPLESKAHRALFDTIRAKGSQLKYSYHVYNINVSNVDEKTEGRMDGQLLAREFVAPHVIGGGYTFVVDVHSNKGQLGQGKYEKTNFIFSPGFDEESTKYQDMLLSQIEELEYYAPEYRTSPEYITIPIVNSGIPTIVYETYSYESMNITYSLMGKLVDSVDNLNFIK